MPERPPQLIVLGSAGQPSRQIALSLPKVVALLLVAVLIGGSGVAAGWWLGEKVAAKTTIVLAGEE